MKLLSCLVLFLLFFRSSDAQIHYIDYDPDISLSAYPNGNRDTIVLDVNEDGRGDFNAAAGSWFQFIHNQCCWNYAAYISGLDSGNAFAYSAVNCSPLFIDSGFCFSSNYTYRAARFGQEGPIGLCQPESYETEFYPFQLIIQGQPHYGWLRVSAGTGSLTIYDGAINMVSGDSICAGQVVGLTETLQRTSLRVFPNPASDYIEIQSIYPQLRSNLIIKDFAGREVMKKEILGTGSVRLSVSMLASGLYIVSLESGRSTGVCKLVVE